MSIDGVYEERNRVVAVLARCFPSGLAKTDIPGWDKAWHNCVYIDLPTGQASWHFHDRDAPLFKGLPPYSGEWDGHTTPEKYRRLEALAKGSGQGGYVGAAIAERDAARQALLELTNERDALREQLRQQNQPDEYLPPHIEALHKEIERLRGYELAEVSAIAERDAAIRERDAARFQAAEWRSVAKHYELVKRGPPLPSPSERETALAEAAQEFIDKCDRGEVRSVRSYATFKAALVKGG